MLTVKVRKQTIIVWGVVLLGLAFLTVGVLMRDPPPKYYAHSLRNWQEADAVPGYPINIDGEVENPEFWTAEFSPNVNLFTGIERYVMPVAHGFSHPLGDFTLTEEEFQSEGLLGVWVNSSGGGILSVGDPVYAPGNGLVLFAGPSPGYPGQVVVLGHRLTDARIVTTLYAGMEQVTVRVGKVIARGEQLAALASVNDRVGLYFEVREAVGLDVTYEEVAQSTLNAMKSENLLNRLDPIAFLKAHASSSKWPEPLSIMNGRPVKNFTDVIQFDAKDAERMGEILGGEE